MNRPGGSRAYRDRVYELLLTLHVVAAVLLVGPFVLAAFWANWAIRRRDAEAVRLAGRFMAWASAGTLLVAVLGAAALSRSSRFSFGTPWVLISSTLYIVTLGVATGYAVPAVRHAAQLVQRSVLVGAGDDSGAGGAEPDLATGVADPAVDPVVKERLDNVAGRVAGAGMLVLILIVVIVVLMVTRPFGA
jgi:uncharacterized membrane protein